MDSSWEERTALCCMDKSILALWDSSFILVCCFQFNIYSLHGFGYKLRLNVSDIYLIYTQYIPHIYPIYTRFIPNIHLICTQNEVPSLPFCISLSLNYFNANTIL